MRNTLVRFFLLSGSAILACYVGFFALDATESAEFVGRFGYWQIFAAFILFVQQVGHLLVESITARGSRFLVGHASSSIRAFLSGSNLQRVFFPICFLLLVFTTLWHSQPKQFKIVMDEPVLVATSLQMHTAREAYAAGNIYHVEGIPYPREKFVDKRPLFYPFLMSLLHDWTGYRASQGIVLNGGLLLCLLSMLYLAGTHVCRPYGGYVLVALFSTVPLVIVNATGSGFDLLNLLLILGLMFILAEYLKNPRARQQNILVLSALLLAQTRYESVLFILPVAVAIISMWYLRKKVTITATLILSPLLLIVYALQRKVMNAHDFFWQLPDHLSAPFSYEYLAANLGRAANFFFASGVLQPSSPLLTWTFILSLVSLLYLILTRREMNTVPSHKMKAGAAVIAIVVVNFFILMCYHWGQLDDPAATRLALPALLMQSIFVVYVLGLFKIKTSWQSLLCILLVTYFMVAVRPVLARTNFLNYTIRNTQSDYLVDLGSRLNEPTALIISDRTIPISIGGLSSLDLKTALREIDKVDLHARLRTFRPMYVVYLMTTKLASENLHEFADINAAREQIEATFDLETVELKKLNGAIYLRLARVIGLKKEIAERSDLDMRGMSIDSTGKMDFADPQLLKDYAESLP